LRLLSWSASARVILSPEERRISDRLFLSDFTFEEGLQLYSSITANGRVFPADWEIRVLRLGLKRHPDRQDMSNRLALLLEQSSLRFKTKAFFERTLGLPLPGRLAYASCFVLLLIDVLLALSGRIVFSVMASAGVVWSIVFLSSMKRKYLKMNLHAYDLVFFPREFATLRFVIENVGFFIKRPAIAFVATDAILCAIWFVEPSSVPRLLAAYSVPAFVAAYLLARKSLPPFTFRMQYFDTSHLIPFLETIPEACSACLRGGVFAAQSSTKHILDTRPTTLNSPALRPNIIVVLQESVFPPALYPRISYDRALNEFFRSQDGSERLLHVETFGSGTWMTEFSLLTGIPANSYGAFRAHLMSWAAGKIKHTLPWSLRNLGYNTAVHYPCSFEVLSARKFFETIGFEDLLTPDSLELNGDNVPDFQRYGRALDWLASHFETEQTPAFLYMMTSSNHFPHDVTLFPDRPIRQEVDRGNEDEVNEYLRRLAMSAEDWTQFRSELSTRFPDREFLAIHFGDHQPPLAWDFLEEKNDWIDSLQRVPSRDTAFLTYFAVQGIKFDPKCLEDIPQTIEISYLSTAIMMAAGLPLDAVERCRRDMMKENCGQFWFKDSGQTATRLNSELIAAGHIASH
jgi:Sulfatase